MIEPPNSGRRILVCQNRSCRKQGATAVLAAFHVSSLTDITVIGSGCLGQCGNGPMVLVLPEQIWYSRVHPDEVPAMVKKFKI
ncbi:MAG TPA: ferredoxin [Cyanobacteria bacterium UBA8803]|nr:ferredoxin [Cyanobacteria bacterium UBA9273]HBL58104.1 ferredoxin [Cyanobacteria bacterium UBA8803]